MARVLAISSQVVWGPVGNSAAVPPLQANGHEVMQLPTILLSHHPGHAVPAILRVTADTLERMLASLGNAGALDTCDAVITGYFADAGQAQVVAKYIPQIRARTVLIDPVIGDHGKLYVDEEVAKVMRSLLLPLAGIATPNAFELGWLTNRDIQNHDQAVAASRALGPIEVLATSVPLQPDFLETLLTTADKVHSSAAPRLPKVPHGTGDYLAGLYLAYRLKFDTDTAFRAAMAGLEQAIAASIGSSALAVIRSAEIR